MFPLRCWIQRCLLLLLSVGPQSLLAQETEKVFGGHLDAVTMGAFTPAGNAIVTVSFDQTARLWEIASQAELRQYTQHTGPIYCLAISGDGTTLATGAQDNTLRLWDLPLGKPLRVFDEHEQRVNAIALSPTGDALASVSADQTVQIRSLGEVDQPIGTRLGHLADVLAVAYRSDGGYLASSDAAGRVLLWSPYLDEPQAEYMADAGAITQLQFVSNNQQLLTADGAGVVRMWQWLPSEPKASILREMPIHKGAVRSMALYGGGSQVLTCGDDETIVMTNTANGAVVRQYHVKTSDSETAAAAYQQIKPTVVTVRSDNQRVAAGTEGGDVFVWSVNDGETPVLAFQVDSPVTALAYSPDNQKLVVATAAPAVQIFGPSIPGSQPQLELTRHQQFATAAVVTDIVFAADNQSVWASLDNGQIQQWQYAGLAQRRQLNHGGPVYGVAVSKDGTLAVTCSADQTVRVWDAATGQQKSQLRGHNGAVHAIAMSQDETFAVSSGADGTLRLWDIIGGRQLKQLTKFDSTMYSLAIHPEGHLIAAAGADRQVHLLDMITGEVRQTLTGHSDYIHCVAFDSSGDRLLSYGYAGHLKIWNSADGKLLSESRIGKVGNYAQFSPDGKQILLSNGDGTARIIPVPSSS